MGSITDPNHVPRRDFPPRRSVPKGLLSALPFGAGDTVYTRPYNPRSATDITLTVNADQDGTSILQRMDDLGQWHDQAAPCPITAGVEKQLVIWHPGRIWRVCYMNTNATPGTVRVEVVERSI